MPPINIEALGSSSDLFVSSRADGKSIVVGGTLLVDGAPGDDAKWMRVLSIRAARVLWYRLTLLLFPERASDVTARVTTAPLRPITGSLAVTTHVEVTSNADNSYDVAGTVGDVRWTVRVSNQEARRLWTALDMALYPGGWDETDQETRLPRVRQTYQ